MEVRATAKFIRRSPRKVRLVMDVVRGKPVKEALALLRFMPQRAARDVFGVVQSAAANAENNFNLTLETLYVKRAIANEGPRLKRAWFRGRGRRDTKLHRLAHLEVVLDSKE